MKKNHRNCDAGKVFEYWRTHKELKKYLYYHDKTHCFICGGKYEVRHHIKALLEGGKDEPKNIALLCSICHKYIPLKPEDFWKMYKSDFKFRFSPRIFRKDALNYYSYKILTEFNLIEKFLEYSKKEKFKDRFQDSSTMILCFLEDINFTIKDERRIKESRICKSK